MKLPRDIGGMELAKKLQRFGYQITRQTGSHIRLTTQQKGEHHRSALKIIKTNQRSSAKISVLSVQRFKSKFTSCPLVCFVKNKSS